ncbi:WXG100 family type VII secretion target [Nocardia nova]|uniref:WXG100 family type VII secretion target n=1 Tax=Nocardia nova TaxID=37330 RepID=UPI002739A2C6|nr:WXG100 family type VII secretion target [Nocardia nova]
MTSPDAAAEFALVPEHVRDAGQFVQQTAHALISGVRSADTEVQGLMATWKGSAADSYLTGWEEARQAAVDVLETLQTMAELLGVVIESFEGVESGNSAALASPPSMSILNM